MSERDNPFGSEPPSDPFGSGPPTDPFGRKPAPDDPFAAPAPADDPVSAPSPAAGPSDVSQPTDAWRESALPQDPFAPPPPPNEPSRRNAEGAIPALILGIIGLVFCPLVAPFAWYLGRKAERLVDASNGGLTGRGEATAGKILGIVACVLMILGIVLLIVLLAVGSSIDTSGSDGGTSVEVQNF
jgi:hypothetical protein